MEAPIFVVRYRNTAIKIAYSFEEKEAKKVVKKLEKKDSAMWIYEEGTYEIIKI